MVICLGQSHDLMFSGECLAQDSSQRSIRSHELKDREAEDKGRTHTTFLSCLQISAIACIAPCTDTSAVSRGSEKRSEGACLGNVIQCLDIGNHNFNKKLGEVSEHTVYQDQTLTQVISRRLCLHKDLDIVTTRQQ